MPPGFPPMGMGGPGGPGGPGRPQAVVHMERIMRDKDGHVFKVVEERTVKPDDIPNIIKTGGIGIPADSDPIKALKKLQR